LEEIKMQRGFKILAIAAALAAGASSAAMAQYVCPPGYGYYRGVCQPVQPQGYGNPVSGAVSGEAAGAASGYAVGGPVGAVVGGALGTAAGTVSGTANAVGGAVAPACGYGYHWYNGYCYPNR
jgi:outer membrane lipoprotein SlyB